MRVLLRRFSCAAQQDILHGRRLIVLLFTGGRYVGHKNRTSPKSDNVYIRLLTKVRDSV